LLFFSNVRLSKKSRSGAGLSRLHLFTTFVVGVEKTTTHSKIIRLTYTPFLQNETAKKKMNMLIYISVGTRLGRKLDWPNQATLCAGN